MSGNLSKSMRENYDTHGVDEYYKIVGSSYRNPHFPGIKLCMNIFMNKWWQYQHRPSDKGVLVCDLACGSGEVTIALQEWWTTCQTQNQSTPSAPARPAVPRPVVSPPRPVVVPLRPAVSPPIPTSSRAQPLAFPRISSVEPPLRIVATDPYTSDAYRTRTGLPCIPMSFHDVAVEGLPDASKVSFEEIESELKGEEKVDVADKDETVNADHGEATTATVEDSHPEDREIYDLVICSFALHLLTTPGSLYELLSTLSYGARWLVVLEPHKKPEIKEGWGWTLWDVTVWQEAQGREGEFVKESALSSL
ncbi:hypothetical protein RHS04_00629 [Rhizoctonia solani]|uniref:Methyltransferase domain-containing protein n=1 Tax=Rhizoctonia solani TaxID=456999 RepID=A0A8H7HIU8_9AGAM|nr:hypothetical protein RHS04_00629 [Rhizoctonia solani]